MPLLKIWQLNKSLTLGVHLTKCIVTDPPLLSEISSTLSGATKSLIVPTNPTLTSTTLFPYFKRGSDPFGWWTLHIPPDNYKNAKLDWEKSSKWGGMEAQENMLYPVQTVDGLVHIHGGLEYHRKLEEIREKINPGKAIKLNDSASQNTSTPFVLQSPAFGNLKSKSGYNNLLHVAVPVYRPERCSDSKALKNCYTETLSEVFQLSRFAYEEKQNVPDPTSNFNNNENTVIYSPLMGAGCRNWPIDIAAKAAIDSIQEIGENRVFDSFPSSCHIGIVVIDKTISETIIKEANCILKCQTVK